MSLGLREKLRVAFAPPRSIALPLSGMDLSTSGVKAVRLAAGPYGLTLANYTASWLPSGAFIDGDIADKAAVVEALTTAARTTGISATNATLSESKSYLFETTIKDATKVEWRTSIEQRLDELIPLPPPEVSFDIVGVGQSKEGDALVVGVGFARRIVDETLAAFDQARIEVRALEGEPFAMARALIPAGDMSTVLIIDVGKTTTKLSIVAGRIPRFATTIGIGGHALTPTRSRHSLDGEIPELIAARQAIRELFGQRWLRPQDNVLGRTPADLSVGQEVNVRGLAVLEARRDARDQGVAIHEPHS